MSTHETRFIWAESEATAKLLWDRREGSTRRQWRKPMHLGNSGHQFKVSLVITKVPPAKRRLRGS